jgi:hypothetical protein
LYKFKRLKAKLKSFCNSSYVLFNNSSFATKIYLPVIIFFSFSRTIALNFLLALLLQTAFPTFFEVTKPICKFSLDLKKATKDGVCHFLPL